MHILRHAVLLLYIINCNMNDDNVVDLILVLISDKTVVLIMFYLGHFSLDGTKQSGTSSCSSISSLERVQSFID